MFYEAMRNFLGFFVLIEPPLSNREALDHHVCPIIRPPFIAACAPYYPAGLLYMRNSSGANVTMMSCILPASLVELAIRSFQRAITLERGERRSMNQEPSTVFGLRLASVVGSVFGSSIHNSSRCP